MTSILKKTVAKKSSKTVAKKSSKSVAKKSSKSVAKKSSKSVAKKSSKSVAKKSSKTVAKKSSKSAAKKSSKTADTADKLIYFNVNKKLFNDGSSPEWYIWMKADDTSIWYRGKMLRNKARYLDAPFFSKNNSVKTNTNIIQCPVNRAGTIYANVEFRGKKDTFRNVLQTIYEYYNQYITDEDLETDFKYINDPSVKGYSPMHDDDYITRFREKNGRRVKRYQMLGEKGLLEKHNPYTCSGLVRWGFFGKCKKNGCYTLQLES